MAGAALIVRRYAAALLELAAASGEVEAVERELAALREQILASDELSRHLASPRLSRESKKRLIHGVLGDRGPDLVRRTTGLLVDRGRAALVVELADSFRDLAMAAGGRAVAQVTSAEPLSEPVRASLVAELSNLTGAQVSLKESVDPGLLGGLRIVIGSRMLDGSVARALSDIQARLLRAPLPLAAAFTN